MVAGDQRPATNMLRVADSGHLLDKRSSEQDGPACKRNELVLTQCHGPDLHLPGEPVPQPVDPRDQTRLAIVHPHEAKGPLRRPKSSRPSRPSDRRAPAATSSLPPPPGSPPTPAPSRAPPPGQSDPGHYSPHPPDAEHSRSARANAQRLVDHLLTKADLPLRAGEDHGQPDPLLSLP